MKIKLFKVRVFFLLSVLNFPVSSWAVGVTNHAIDFVSGSGDAKILLLDGDSVNRSFLTKVNRQIEASYSFDSRGRYQANSISGFVSSKWRELEMASQGERSLLNNYRSKGELLRNYKANTIIDPKSENSILRKHSIFPLESTTYYNPEDKVVIAQDFQTALPENICQVLEWPSINLELEMKKFEDEIVKIIQIHNIEIVSRSMRRNVYRQFGIASRTCDNFDLKKLINLVRLEQGLLENIVKRTNVIFLNSALNDPENYTLWDKGERFVNPLYKYRPKGILFVGYTNNPNFLFRASGSPIVDRMISSNQRQNGNIIDFYIDGNLHEDDLNRSIDEYWETEDYYNLGSLWWERDSFHFIYGHSIKAHLYLSPENIVTSGFSTSWATPIAASLVNYFLTKERVPRDKLIEELKDKVFDPYSNKQFLRRE